MRKGSNLIIVAVLALIIEVKEVSLSSSPSMVEGNSHEGSDGVSIAESFHGRVSNVDGMKHRFLPVRVLVPYSGEYFIEMVVIRVSYVGAKYFVALIFLKAELYFVVIKVEISFGTGDPKDQGDFDKSVTHSFHIEARIGVVLIDW